ncbi:MAG: integration host factor subunit alpha [Deltaproteobacteria bacterium]|nr:integration host factor subunit alpha [Deltaproteobacteria bacterium]
MTKSDMADKIRSKVGLTSAESLAYVNSFFDFIKSEVEGDGQIKLAGFGSFLIKEKKRRRGRNPQTGKPIYISERRVLKFRPSVVLKSKINKKYKNGSGG